MEHLNTMRHVAFFPYDYVVANVVYAFSSVFMQNWRSNCTLFSCILALFTPLFVKVEVDLMHRDCHVP